MRWNRTVAATAAAGLAVTLAGCWEQPGHDAGRSRNNPDETTITAANVGGLEELWSTDTGQGAVGEPLSAGGKVYVATSGGGTAEHRAAALDAVSGAVAWSSDLLLDPQHELFDPVHLDGNVVIPFSFLRFGGYRRVADSTGAVATDTGTNTGAWDAAVIDGELVTTTFSYGSVIPSPFGYGVQGPCTASVVGIANSDPFPMRDFAFVGDDLMWSKGTSAAGFTGACDPGTGDYTGTWTTPLGGSPLDVAAVGDDAVAYSDDTGTVTVLDSATGAVRWTAEGGAGSLAVTGTTVFVAGDDALTALDAATGAVLWSGAATGPAVPTVAGDVVYVAEQSTGAVLAFDRDGCGAVTCTPLTTLDAGGALSSGATVDDGRVLVGTADGRVVAFGLPA
jgi:outer membrane protein assembly factor BamB